MSWDMLSLNGEAELVVRFLLLWSWQALLAFGLVWLLLKVSGSQQSSLRYKVWLYGLTLVLLFPAFFLLRHLTPETHQPAWMNSAVITPVYFLASTQGVPSEVEATLPEAGSAAWSLPIWGGALAIYLVGSLVTSFYFCLSFLHMRRAIRSSRIVRCADVARSAAEFIDDQVIRVGLSPRVSSPVLVGLLRPLILLPADILEWTSEEEREAILRHEQAHFRRRDHYVNPLQILLAVLFYFHPVVRYALRQMSLEREAACDDAVLTTGVSKAVYAGSLVKVLEKSLIVGTTYAYSPFATRNSIHRRIDLIMKHSLTKQPGRSRLLIISTLLLVSVAVFTVPSRMTVDAAPPRLAALSAKDVPVRQDKERVLLPLPVEEGRQSPMQIIAARVGNQRVEPGRSFTAGEGWYRDLTLTLKNVSTEPISYVEVALLFDTPKGSPTDYATYPLRYGIHPSMQDRSAVPERAKAVPPGESVELKVAESDLATLTRLLAQAGVQPEVDHLKFDIRAIGFEREPDLMWTYGYLMRRNAANPSRFDAVGRYTLTK